MEYENGVGGGLCQTLYHISDIRYWMCRQINLSRFSLPFEKWLVHELTLWLKIQVNLGSQNTLPSIVWHMVNTYSTVTKYLQQCATPIHFRTQLQGHNTPITVPKTNIHFKGHISILYTDLMRWKNKSLACDGTHSTYWVTVFQCAAGENLQSILQCKAPTMTVPTYREYL